MKKTENHISLIKRKLNEYSYDEFIEVKQYKTDTFSLNLNDIFADGKIADLQKIKDTYSNMMGELKDDEKRKHFRSIFTRALLSGISACGYFGQFQSDEVIRSIIQSVYCYQWLKEEFNGSKGLIKVLKATSQIFDVVRYASLFSCLDEKIFLSKTLNHAERRTHGALSFPDARSFIEVIFRVGVVFHACQFIRDLKAKNIDTGSEVVSLMRTLSDPLEVSAEETLFDIERHLNALNFPEKIINGVRFMEEKVIKKPTFELAEMCKIFLSNKDYNNPLSFELFQTFINSKLVSSLSSYSMAEGEFTDLAGSMYLIRNNRPRAIRNMLWCDKEIIKNDFYLSKSHCGYDPLKIYYAILDARANLRSLVFSFYQKNVFFETDAFLAAGLINKAKTINFCQKKKFIEDPLFLSGLYFDKNFSTSEALGGHNGVLLKLNDYHESIDYNRYSHETVLCRSELADNSNFLADGEREDNTIFAYLNEQQEILLERLSSDKAYFFSVFHTMLDKLIKSRIKERKFQRENNFYYKRNLKQLIKDEKTAIERSSVLSYGFARDMMLIILRMPRFNITVEDVMDEPVFMKFLCGVMNYLFIFRSDDDESEKIENYSEMDPSNINLKKLFDRIGPCQIAIYLNKFVFSKDLKSFIQMEYDRETIDEFKTALGKDSEFF